MLLYKKLLLMTFGTTLVTVSAFGLWLVEGVSVYCEVRVFFCYNTTEESSHLWCSALSTVKY